MEVQRALQRSINIAWGEAEAFARIQLYCIFVTKPYGQMLQFLKGKTTCIRSVRTPPQTGGKRSLARENIIMHKKASQQQARLGTA